MLYFKEIKTGDVYAYEQSDLDEIAKIGTMVEETSEDGDVVLVECEVRQVFHGIKEKLKGMAPLTGAALEEHLNPTPTTEQLADKVRAERDAKIEAVRWRIERAKDEAALGAPLTEPLEPLLQYVQALRDVPQQAGFPENVEWPVEP